MRDLLWGSIARGCSPPETVALGGLGGEAGESIVNRLYNSQQRQVPRVNDQMLLKLVQQFPPVLTDQHNQFGGHEVHLTEVPGQRDLAQGSCAAGEGDEGIALD